MIFLFTFQSYCTVSIKVSMKWPADLHQIHSNRCCKSFWCLHIPITILCPEANLKWIVTSSEYVTFPFHSFQGWFEATEMYYGTYINGTINIQSGHSNGSYHGLSGSSYDMAYAYLLTSGGFYLLCLVILARA
jgi:hypothetical protein